MKLSEAMLVGFVSALVAVAGIRYLNYAGSTELQLASQPAFDRVMRTHTLRCAYSSLPGYYVRVDPAHNITKGLVRDITEQMGRILNLKIEWTEEVSPTQVADNLASGREDAMCFPLWPNGKQAASFEYLAPLDYMPIYAYARADDTRFDGDLSKLNDKNMVIPVIPGGAGNIIADEDYPLAAHNALGDDATSINILLAVTTKNADVAFIDPFTGDEFIRNNPGTLKRVANVPPVRVFGERMAVAKGEVKLRDMLNVALEQMQNSGFIRSTLSKYLAGHEGQYYFVTKPWEQ